MHKKPNQNGYCIKCRVNGIGKKRSSYGHLVCKACGDDKAKTERKLWCIAPMHKSNYTLITNPADLLGINNKGGLVK